MDKIYHQRQTTLRSDTLVLLPNRNRAMRENINPLRSSRHAGAKLYCQLMPITIHSIPTANKPRRCTILTIPVVIRCDNESSETKDME